MLTIFSLMNLWAMNNKAFLLSACYYFAVARPNRKNWGSIQHRGQFLAFIIYFIALNVALTTHPEYKIKDIKKDKQHIFANPLKTRFTMVLRIM